jgi:BON domain-containing protein
MTRATAALAAGVGLGAGLMYFLDPHRGARRRTHARNQMIHASHAVRENARAQLGALRRAAAEVDVDDRVLAERVRAILGRVVTHAHAVVLEVSKGVVTVSGPVLRNEIRRTVKALARVPGVRAVINALEAHPVPRRMPVVVRDRRLAWTRDRDTVRRVATALAGAASLGLVARAAMNAREQEFELRS